MFPAEGTHHSAALSPPDVRMGETRKPGMCEKKKGQKKNSSKKVAAAQILWRYKKDRSTAQKKEQSAQEVRYSLMCDVRCDMLFWCE